MFAWRQVKRFIPQQWSPRILKVRDGCQVYSPNGSWWAAAACRRRRCCFCNSTLPASATAVPPQQVYNGSTYGLVRGPTNTNFVPLVTRYPTGVSTRLRC